MTGDNNTDSVSDSEAVSSSSRPSFSHDDGDNSSRSKSSVEENAKKGCLGIFVDKIMNRTRKSLLFFHFFFQF